MESKAPLTAPAEWVLEWGGGGGGAKANALA